MEADLIAVGNNINLLHALNAAQDTNITAKANKSDVDAMDTELAHFANRLDDCCPEAGAGAPRRCCERCGQQYPCDRHGGPYRDC